jgi:mannose-6-phosphate isomerase-like protein (cupin superfamily)
MKTALLMVACFIPLQAADSTEPLFWSARQMSEIAQKAVAALNPDRHLGTERMLDSAFVAFRNGSGEAEVHVKQADLILVKSGTGTVLVGGKIVEGKPSAADEIRGKAIEGGTKYPIAAGDTLYIPANTVHQFVIEPGQSFTAMVVKITPKP